MQSMCLNLSRVRVHHREKNVVRTWRPTTGEGTTNGTHPLESEHVPCPTDTKFSYYNNYNLSQPRHFCKSCRRYCPRRRWDPQDFLLQQALSHRSEYFVLEHAHDPIPANPVTMVSGMKPDIGLPLFGGSFTSLLNTQGAGLLALGGFGLTGLNEMGFGLGTAVWPVEEASGGNGGGGGCVHGSSSGCNNWQMGGRTLLFYYPLQWLF